MPSSTLEKKEGNFRRIISFVLPKEDRGRRPKRIRIWLKSTNSGRKSGAPGCRKRLKRSLIKRSTGWNG
jgi:hypothetical protein